MRAITACFGFALLTSAAPAFAQDGEAYVAFDAGAILPVDFDSDIDAVREDGTSSGKLGWGAGARAGYDWGWLRAEIETSYQTFGADEITSATQGLPDSNALDALAAGRFDYEGDFSLTSVMANTLAEFGDADDVQFAVGGGVGRSWMNADTALVGSGVRYLNASDSEWAWQAIAEARVPVSGRVDVGLRYRYFSTLEFEVPDALGRETQFELATHSLALSVRIGLGGRSTQPLIQPTAPPIAAVEPRPVRPTPPAPTVPPPPPCERGPYIVYFDWDNAEISERAAGVLDSTVAAFENCGNVSVMLAGHADRSGSQGYNVALSQRRNAAVREYLNNRGVDGSMITAEAFGETRGRVRTSDGVRELQNRRVEIMFGPGSGS